MPLTYTPAPKNMAETLDLFPDHPAPVPGSMMELVAMPGIKLTPMQRTFKRLVAEIEATERSLQERGELLDVFRPRFSAKLNPLQDERDAINRELALFLDEKLARKGWTANQRKTMRDLICDVAEMLFGSAYHDEMQALFDRHSDMTLADLAASGKKAFVEDLEKVLGVELDAEAIDARGPEEILREAMEQIDEEEHAREQAAAVRAPAKRGGKKSARMIAAEQQALDAGKLLKEIYRKLISTLHPDREPDIDERARKTALMSEVNKAYADENLLRLLHLQLQAGKVDSRAAATMADERLRIFNHSLSRQNQELKLECRHLEALIREEFRLEGFGALSVPVLQKALNAQAATARAGNKGLSHDLAAIKRSEAEFKSWLKVQREAAREDEWLDEFMLEELMRAKPRRRR
jgi:hypothetical protein